MLTRGITFLIWQVTDLIDGMLVIDPNRRLTVQQVLDSPWVNGRIVADADGGQAVYRGVASQQYKDPDELRAMLMAESDEAMAPVYRGGPQPGATPPMLQKQEPMFCADFMLE